MTQYIDRRVGCKLNIFFKSLATYGTVYQYIISQGSLCTQGDLYHSLMMVDVYLRFSKTNFFFFLPFC